ncbi:MAG: nucleotidyl transferase AbiEii/AbiGii toxin family protein [Coprobacillus sp.]
MNNIIEQMLKEYDIKNNYDRENAIKEIMQEIVLCGLSRAGFFKSAAFYGGTALRIFYKLDRFSEDLDFSLLISDPCFDLKKYFPILEKEVRSFGLNVELHEKAKSNKTNIKSAFIKGGTIEHLLLFYPNLSITGIHKDKLIKIKFEIDINPPQYANYEYQYRLLPAPYEIQLYDAPSLFAGKIHAVICRGWKNRVKGRDLYDFIFFLSIKTPVNLIHLRERLIQSGFITDDKECTLDDVKLMLEQHFDKIDYNQAKKDVEPFIRDITILNIWSASFFKNITQSLTSST